MNPKDIWQNQKSENPTMSVQEIREKVGKLRAKLRRERVFNLVVATVCMLIFIRVFVLYAHSAYERISWGLVIAGALYILGYVVYGGVQTMRAERLYENAGISSSLRFYRRTLEQKRQHVRRMPVGAILLVAGAVMEFLPAVALTIQHPEGKMWIRLVPFCIILSGWFVLIMISRHRQQREFQREFAMLEMLEMEYSHFPKNDK